ncbi:MAG: T9SS type A sorting domain-containing protein [Candidatus Cloacimonadales bacterium]|nr:T9SS type A sorting domain-containing protein [Candidatus Cloacimonadales bacterium]
MKQILVIFLSLFAFIQATIINIPADQPTIQAGINVAAEGDTVLVAAGIYYENIIWSSENGIKLIGSGETDCIIDGDSLGSVIRMSYIIGTATVIDGFTIQNGYANGNIPFSNGGGIYCNEVSLHLSNLTIIDNSANEEGGGVFCWYSDLNLFDVSIINNFSSTDLYGTGGGGIHSKSSTLNLANVVFEDNIAVSSGGGLCCISSTLDIVNADFSNNSCLYEGFGDIGGGGMFCTMSSSPYYLEDISFSNNSSGSNGGGICFNMVDAEMKNVYVTNNSALYYGGGIYFKMSDSELTNVLITNNTSELSGGGFSINGSFPILKNVNIIDNISNQGGGISIKIWGPSLVNCILWNNEPEEIYCIDFNSLANIITISYSDIQGGESGIITNNNGTVNWLDGNIDDNPLFLGLGEYPYALQFDSPCIDAGTPDTTGLSLPEYDLAGNPRIFGGRIDMGAYEWQGTPVSDELGSVSYKLSNYPNPFNPSTTISFSLTAKDAQDAKIEIFNLKGQKVIDLSVILSGVEGTVTWNGDDEEGKSVCSGIYFYKLKFGKHEETKKMLLMK